MRPAGQTNADKQRSTDGDRQEIFLHVASLAVPTCAAVTVVGHSDGPELESDSTSTPESSQSEDSASATRVHAVAPSAAYDLGT
jgi:hypothetical protein